MRRWLAAAQHILGDTAFADVDAELEQLAVNARCTPRGILPTHLADQVSSLAGNRRSSALSPPNLPGPKQAKAHAMPSHNRLRLDDASVERQSRQIRDGETQRRRSAEVNLGRFFSER